MKRVILPLFMLMSFVVGAQDPEFSQYYAAPLYLNPAFAGTSPDHRFIANYRNQWPNIAFGYQTFAISYDYNLDAYNSGVGLMVLTDKAGTAGMKSTEFDFLYSYKVNVNDQWVISPGISFGYAFRSIDFNKLLFGDQLQFDNTGNVPSDDPAGFNAGNTHYFDFDAGLLVYNKSFWLGVAGSHLNKPNRSLLDLEAKLPIKTTIHGGVRIPLYNGPFKKDRISVFSPSFVYKRQGRFDQLDLGAYFLYEPIALGLWYRGIPLQQEVDDNMSRDAVVVILGFQFEKAEIGYSYDITVSQLGSSSGGTHEISLSYRMDTNLRGRPRQKQKLIPCPTFNHK